MVSMLRALLGCLGIAAGISCNEPQSLSAPVTLRVGASSGLSSFRARTFSGATPYAMELVYSLLREHATLVTMGPTRLAMHPRPESPHSAELLCDRLLDDTGVVRRTSTPEQCILDFGSPAARSAFESYPWLLLDHGPFQWERELDTEGRPVAHPGREDAAIGAVEMVSRGRTAVDRIHIATTPLHEAWRRLLARQLDVIPVMSSLHRHRFAGVRSVRTIEIPVSAYMHLFFNTRVPAWADADLRRHVARLVEPRAVAAVACGDPGCGVSSWRPAPPRARVELPPRLTIRVLSSHSSAVVAAEAISYRIRLHHEVDVVVEPVSIDTLASPEGRDGYALVLVPLGILASADPGIVAESLAVHAGYQSPAFIAAAERGDAAEMQRILEHDVPALPLYELRNFAAVDARFCGGKPTHTTSWAWLSELYPCPGEAAP